MSMTSENVKSIREYIQVHQKDAGAYKDLFNCLVALKEEDKQLCYMDNLWLRAACTEQISHSNDGTFSQELYDVLHKTYILPAQDDLHSYCVALEWEREPDKKFYVPRQRALRPVIKGLQRLADDELDLLTISLPPGVGKTTSALFFLSWLSGIDPNRPILTCSHSNAFLRGAYEECLRIMQPGEYCWNDVFPGRKVAKTNAQDMNIDIDLPVRFSKLEFTSVGSGNAGKVRAEQLLYCDDLVDGIETAMSKERMDKLWNQYTTDLKQRRIGKCKELHIATRWSVNDVIGRLERLHEDDERAEFISIPALDENDESNFDYGDNHAGFTTAFYHDMRDTMDDISWRALYMNQPIEREGLLYIEDDLRRFYELPQGEPDAIISVCDTAEGGGDDTFMPVGYVYGEDHYIFDCVCSNALPEVTDDLCADALIRNKVQLSRFESNSAGGRTADSVQAKVKARGGITHITKKRTTTNKETKIIVNSAWVKEHCLFKDKKVIQRKSAYEKMMNKLCTYTLIGKQKHDDVPDGMAQYAIFAQSLGQNVVKVEKRFF